MRPHPHALLLCAGLAAACAARAGEPDLLCSDLHPAPPTELHKVRNKVIYDEIVAGVFPGALFPLSYRENHEVSASGLYYDDQGRVLSGKAAVAILENHPASQDLILAWRSNTEAESTARLEVAGGVAGVMVGDPLVAVSSPAQVASAADNLGRLDGGAESAFAQAVCTFNAAQTQRRASARREPSP